MSRTRNLIVATAGVAAGLFLGELASSATAAADPATIPAPGLPGLVEQIVTSPASIPQQILATTSSALAGTPAVPASPPLANATITLPQTPAAGLPGMAPAAPTAPTGLAAMPGDLSRILPFPLPNFGTTPTAPTATAPSLVAPPATVPGLVAPPATLTLPQTIEPAMRFPVSGLP